MTCSGTATDGLHRTATRTTSHVGRTNSGASAVHGRGLAWTSLSTLDQSGAPQHRPRGDSIHSGHFRRGAHTMEFPLYADIARYASVRGSRERHAGHLTLDTMI